MHMKVGEWLEFFKKNRSKKTFSLSDLVVLTGENRPSMSVQLSRLVRSGLIDHPVRGWYSNPLRPPSDEELAMVIRNPSYFSMEYALSRHGILSQSTLTYTLITTKLPRTYHVDGRVFEYHQVKRSLFWGYRSEGTALAAEPEKALLDLIYVRSAKRGGIEENLLDSLMDDMYLEDLDLDRLWRYSSRFNGNIRKILSKRLKSE
jgi:hypothetical protein